MRETHRIYLASQSPRRRELLKQIGVNFSVLLIRASPGRQDVEEVPLADESPAVFCVRMAHEKSAAGERIAAMRNLERLPVLGADTVVDLDGEILGKPENEAHAAEILGRLSGRAHWVHTGVAMTREGETRTMLSSSKVIFAPLSGDAIERYLETREYLDKAGAYGIQGHAGLFAERIEGSFTGIMGLPLHETGCLLDWAGIQL